MKSDRNAEALAEELLGRPFCDLDEEEQRVLHRIVSGELITMDADEEARIHITFGDRLADRVAAIGGSWGFIIAFGLILAAWMLLNGPLRDVFGAWDAYPFIFLNLVLSTLAALQAPVIMMSQNRSSRKDRVTARHDYEVNLRTQLEIVRLHRKFDKMFNKLGQMQGSIEGAALVTEAVVEQALEAEAVKLGMSSSEPRPDPVTRFAFTLDATDSVARTGRITMRRGEIRTPAFMPVGTAATVKAMKPEAVRATGADIILGNTYHLMLRPGAERMARLGGLHKFMNWDRPILTDSGGYQVMSLSALRKITEEGVTFASHLDGSRHLLSPERSMEIQRLLGSDIVMAFDECPRADAAVAVIADSMRMSMRWAKRSREAFDAGGEHAEGAALFGIQQGALDENLRRESADALREIGFDGYAIGGLAVGEGQEAMFATLDFAAGMLPADAPRYLMGVGKPDDLVGAVARGVDMFDCVLPTRSGRNGQAFTWNGPLNLRNARHAEDTAPLDPRCGCPACADYGRAYLHHLIKSGEMLGAMLLTEHNLWFYQALMAAMREAIGQGRFSQFSARFHADYFAPR